MGVKRGALLLIMLPMAIGMRDPFQPPEDHCHIAQLSQWRYQGTIARASRQVGLLRDAQGKWRRVEMNSQLPTGWRVVQLSTQAVEIETGLGCEPARWSWSREGEPHEDRDKHSVTNVNAISMGAKTAAGLVGGG
ncbi:DUF2531 domain-containing protein [Superficieibacter electus]|uniref:DUF2531 domain-containing protein n=1 Tax=Superficieibacter electus TaxID=2022662 RepID=A0A2P5GK51_9ENTR|nr:HofP DNA utilization family protein [Superficieibacter electus]POP43220.1 DUF2531 domain-containing protein [Superficieibacter electus]POP44773.1 DUF2531 domain-containing protein [Superficieibacter electus]